MALTQVSGIVGVVFLLLGCLVSELNARSPALWGDQPCPTLRFGRLAYSSPESVLIAHDPLVRHLEKETGCVVDLRLYVSYEEIARRLNSGELSLGWLGTAFYASRGRQVYLPLVRPRWYGKNWYQGQILVRSDSSIETLADLKAKKIAFVSRSSSSGFIFPRLLLQGVGLHLKDLAGHDFLEKHDAVAYAVFARQFDAGASYVGVLDLPLFEDKRSEFRVISKTALISNEPVVVHQNLPEALAQRLKSAFLSAEDSGALKEIPTLRGFSPVTDADYNTVRFLIQNAE
jgi:phosphonate transport system substrate-binding protein